MSYRFFGHHDYSSNGKFLWEILCQLRGMGVGRYVTKSDWLTKWPNEATYLKVIGMRPQMDRWLQNGRVWAEWTYRGHNLGVYEFSADLNRSGWILIHKHEESKFLGNKNRMESIEIPKDFPVPPLQKHLSTQWKTRYNVPTTAASTKQDERAPLELHIDPQFEHLLPFIKRVEPEKSSSNNPTTIYDEVKPKTFLDFYGNMLPVKVDAWSTDPAKYENHFKPK